MDLLPLPVVIPMLGAGLTLLATRNLHLQRLIAVLSVWATMAATIALLVDVERDGINVHHVGGWSAPFGITLVADLMSALFLTVSMAVILFVQLYAIGQNADTARPRVAHPVYLVLCSGVALAFVTGDLFNLFVAFEIMLMSSYVLLTLGARREQLRAGMTYVVINAVASVFFLTAIALVYGATGTVNLADLSVKFAELPHDLGLALALLLLAVFGTKAAIFPFFFWLPDSYPTAAVSVTAVFAGLLTKVGVYTMIRLTTLLELEDLSPLLLVAACATMVLGVVGAVAQDDVKRILSFHIISQVGYMIMGLGLYSVAGLTGAVLYVIHHIPVKAVLFLVGGLIQEATGTGRLHRIGGLVRRAPFIAVLFVIPALSLVGIPPFSGFLAKLSLIRAGIDAGEWVVVGVALFAGMLTLFSMSKIWAGVFWGAQPDDPTPQLADEDAPLHVPGSMVAATTAMVLLTLVVPVFGGQVYDLAERSAIEILDPDVYRDAVFADPEVDLAQSGGEEGP